VEVPLVRPDGKLYFNIGAPCNICMPPDTHAKIVRINPDGTGLEYIAHGVRNSVGHDFHPVTKELYFSNHGGTGSARTFRTTRYTTSCSAA